MNSSKCKKIITILILAALFAFIQTCDKKSTNNNDNDMTEEAVGSWQMTTTITANTFGMPNGETNTEVIALADSIENILAIINFDGSWGYAEVKGSKIDFHGSELSDDFDAPAVLVTEGSGTISDEKIEGGFETEVYISNAVGSNNPDGTITSSFTMTKLEESPCMSRAVFGSPQYSEYILPFPVGKAYSVYQSYCWPTGGHRNQLAYDFTIPIGDTIVAARAGVVRSLREDSPDNGEGEGQHNFVFIEHADGTAAFYAHLMQNSVVPQIDDTIAAGEYFCLSGNSGKSGEPHLHLGVYEEYPATEGEDVPFNFRNAQGPLDNLNGLIRGQIYEALPY